MSQFPMIFIAKQSPLTPSRYESLADHSLLGPLRLPRGLLLHIKVAKASNDTVWIGLAMSQ